MTKPNLSETTIRHCIMQHLRTSAIQLWPLTEGLDSQTFAFTTHDNDYIIRINVSPDGFLKDAYAIEHYPELPIPPIYHIGTIDSDHIFCISQKAPGYTLQSADEPTIKRLLEPTFNTWKQMSSVDITSTAGFGTITDKGTGIAETWKQFIASIGDPHHYDWHTSIEARDQSTIETLFAALYNFIPAIPEQRQLVHGDFGSNNLLTDGTTITAIIDWDESMYGDALFDIATAYFWSPWLDCMRLFADYCDQNLINLDNYHQRIRCYQLFIGLRNIYDHCIQPDLIMKDWCIQRCLSIIHGA